MATQAEQKKMADDLFDMLGTCRTGMLGVEGSGQHMQPMTHFADPDTRDLWFVTARQTDLVRAIGSGGTAHFIITSDKDDFYACMSGPIGQSNDRERLETIWSPMVEAWFEGGVDDPEVVLLRMPLASASVWRSTVGPVQFGIEMVRALATDVRPDVGEHMVIDFNVAA